MVSSRYISQIRLPEIGADGQKLLSSSSVLIVGCGALGSPLAASLAGAGIGRLVIADFDTVEISNLHRQLYYDEVHAGKKKVEVLAERLRSLNSDIEIIPVDALVSHRLLDSLDIVFDVIADCADNPASTYLLQDFCSKKGLPLSTAGVSGWNAQIFTYIPGSTGYSEIFPKPDDSEGILPCSIAGIIGPTAQLAASIQASEIIKLLLKIGNKKSQLITVDLLNSSFLRMDV